MSVLVKTIPTAKAEGKDPKLEVIRRLLNYHDTPHLATSKPPVELVFRSSIKTKISRKGQLFYESS